MVVNRKEQIVKKAMMLFAKDGYEKVTTNVIAKKCNISEAALYNHFKSKEAIYSAVLKSIQDINSTEEELDKLKPEMDIENLLAGLAGYITSDYCQKSKVIRLLMYSSLQGHKLAREVYSSLRMPYIEFLSGKLRAMIKDGLLLNVNPQITARCFVGMVFDCVMNSILWKGMLGREYSHETVLKNNVPVFARGLVKSG